MIYCYRCNACGYTAEIIKSMSECDSTELCPKDGFVLVRDFISEHPRGHKCGNWPMESDAMGVAASQAVEATEHAASIGIPTEFNKETGSAKFTSAHHRKRYCKAMGFHDRNGSYGDPTPD